METKTEVTQTPGQKVEDLVNADTVKQEQVKTFTQAELDAIVQDRLDREKKKYSDYKELKASAERLKTLESEKLTEQEKATKKLADLEKKITEKEEALNARDLRDKKRTALEAANLGLTDAWTFSDILDLMPGDEESIPQEIEKWKKRFPAKKGLGTGTQMGQESVGAATIQEQIQTINSKMLDPKLTRREKDVLAKQVINLSNRKMRGES